MITDIESATPALCRLQLGSELRDLRLKAGLTSRQVVRKLLWSPSKLTRLETGENAAVETSDIMALCQIFEADPETTELLKGYAAVTKTKRDWWQSKEYRPVISPSFKAFLGLEATASGLQDYESEFVPGLLQTEAYVRVIHQRAHQGLSDEEIDRLVAVRMTRQEVLHRESPLKLTAIINEAVLYRQVGGSAIMRAQLAHIAEVSAAPNVRVQVVPFELGAHAGMNGAFMILQFRDRVALKPIVYFENLADGWVTRREADVERYEESFTDLQALAPGPQESVSMIKKAMKEH
ncbi:helix-turn-helix transcriptional regulator [Streptomyces sp. AK02-01A]|uniref:helix-turn-helix domain-containing protein n=1 Tax=Streptomyces sp. AK02-01A TaxID=3028648 RepID=UPI0029B6C20F|nr:helix-turn-helix transcriptional regulator [Streptomyces sp. AK02-01A]MDX3851804.1 helix-turn-helix transcriptional regulator [Streptomyces sp. AK02-01A]